MRMRHLPVDFQPVFLSAMKGVAKATQRAAEKARCCQGCLMEQVVLNLILRCELFTHDRDAFISAVEDLARGLRTGEITLQDLEARQGAFGNAARH